MPLTSFNVVLTGDNFPVSSVDLSEFSFRHRPFKEIVRLPVLLSAETREARLQLIAERFEVSVPEVREFEAEAQDLRRVFATFEEYVGRRTIRQAGLNFVFVIPGAADSRKRAVSTFLNRPALEGLLGGSGPDSAELVLSFNSGRESFTRLRVGMLEQADMALDFNFHFELADLHMSAEQAVGELESSLAAAAAIAERFSAMLHETPAVNA